MIDLKTLKQLVKLMVDNDLTQLDVEGDQDKVKLRRGPDQGQMQYVAPPVVHPPAAAPASPAAAPAAAPPAEASAPSAEASRSAPTIDSPMVGTFYAAPGPDTQAFVTAGDRVEPDSVVCIIEAMKVFNEIKAETGGTVAKVLVENGQAVEFGQPLFELAST